jgi:hypothetical protein
MDPGPLNRKKRFWADKQQGRHWIKGRPGLKTESRWSQSASLRYTLHRGMGAPGLLFKIFIDLSWKIAEWGVPA